MFKKRWNNFIPFSALKTAYSEWSLYLSHLLPHKHGRTIPLIFLPLYLLWCPFLQVLRLHCNTFRLCIRHLFIEKVSHLICVETIETIATSESKVIIEADSKPREAANLAHKNIFVSVSSCLLDNSWTWLYVISPWTGDIQGASSQIVIYNSFPSSWWQCFKFVGQSCQRKSIRSSLFSEFGKNFFHCFGITCCLLITFSSFPYEHRWVVKGLDSQSRGPMFKTTGWLQGQLSLSSFRGW